MLDDLRELYQEVILDHGKNPRNFGKPDEVSHHANGHNPLCGDRISVYLEVDSDGVVRNAAFDGRGCAISRPRRR
jgi:nitrogen fixation NifU-like protein